MKISTIIADIIMIANRDHGDLQGLTGDDHLQYHTDARAAVLHYLKTAVDTWRAAVTVTEMGYLHGLTSDLQTQLGTKVVVAGDIGGSASAPTITDLSIASEAQGTILYFNGTNWVILAVGTSGQALICKGAGANPVWEDFSPGVGLEATLAMFQANAATGNFLTPANLNDNNTATFVTSQGDTTNIVVDFGKVVCIKRWRQFGKVATIRNAVFKIQYYNLATHAWVDFSSSFALRNTADWSGFTTETEVITDKIRLYQNGNSGGDAYVGEFEVIY